MTRRPLRRAVALGLVAATAGSATIASAASMTVTPTPLTAFSGTAATGLPTVYAADNFAGINNTSIDGRALATGGGTWDVLAGTWRLNGAGGVTGSNSTTSKVLTNAGESDTRTTVVINDGTGGGRDSGVIIRSNATATAYVMVEQTTDTSPSSVRLIGVTPWVSGETVMATVPITLTAPATLSVQAVGANITVSYNGTVLGTYTMNWLEALLYTGGTHYGVFNRNSGTNNVVTFTDFRVESPS